MTEETQNAHADLTLPGSRVTLTGSALAVITLVAILGLIWISVKLVDLSERAMLEHEQPAVTLPAK